MNLPPLTYEGPPIDDPELLARLPDDLRRVLERRNGFVLFGGGFHLRGVCREPRWHSLGEAWSGSLAISRLFPAVDLEDVPFAQDCLGDQYLLRDGRVWLLRAETGSIETLVHDLSSLLDAIERAPVETLLLEPLLTFEAEGGRLQPGQLLSAYPPFCMKESGADVSLRAISCTDRLRFLADLAAQLAQVPDGTKIKFVIGS